MTIKSIMKVIGEHILNIINELNDSEINRMVEEILNAKSIFVLGAGRSGLVARAFAMRLSQLNLTVYVVGETITPGMKKSDLFIVVSGSGETNSVVSAARIAHDIGVRILSITSYPESSLGKLSDHMVAIKGKTKIDIEKDHLKHQIQGVHSSLTPLGTLFEDTVMVFFDGVIGKLMETIGKGERDLDSRHATIE